MSELDEAWTQALAEAARRARAAGRKDIAEYLALRRSNDLLRQTAVNWLGETFQTLAAEANRRGASIQMSQDSGHRFKVGTATMVGRSLTLRYGVRQLLVEAGWPRTPADGFVKGGGLARGNIRHLGMKAADLELLLVQSSTGNPRWMIQREDGDKEMHESVAHEQLAILLNVTRTR